MGGCGGKEGRLGPTVHDLEQANGGYGPGLVRAVHAAYAAPGLQQQHNGLGDGRSMSVAQMPVHVRADFVARVYTALSAQAFAATLISLPFVFLLSQGWATDHIWLFYVSLVGILALVVTAAYLFQAALRDLLCNLCFLAGLTLLTGIAAGFPAVAYSVPAAAIAEGSLATIFCGLAIFACLTRADFMGTGPFLFAAFCGVSVLGVLLIFLDAEFNQKLLGGGGAILVALYTVYNMQLVASGEHLRYDFTIDEHMFAAAGTYVDIVIHVHHCIYQLTSG